MIIEHHCFYDQNRIVYKAEDGTYWLNQTDQAVLYECDSTGKRKLQGRIAQFKIPPNMDLWNDEIEIL